MARDIRVVGAARTAIGSFGGALKEVPTTQLATTVMRVRLNPNGSGLSLGHPVGATGAIIVAKALYELQRVGGGQGIAAVVERA